MADRRLSQNTQRHSRRIERCNRCTGIAPDPATAPPPTAPFTDFRYEEPGNTRKITVADLPPPFATASASNGPSLVPRPPNVWPKAPPGFEVNLYAEGLSMPRVIQVAPNGECSWPKPARTRFAFFAGW